MDFYTDRYYWLAVYIARGFALAIQAVVSAQKETKP